MSTDFRSHCRFDDCIYLRHWFCHLSYFLLLDGRAVYVPEAHHLWVVVECRHRVHRSIKWRHLVWISIRLLQVLHAQI